jgi:hypothetical protein
VPPDGFASGTTKRMEPSIMRGETDELIKRWRGRGITWDTIIARLEQAVVDVAKHKHEKQR